MIRVGHTELLSQFTEILLNNGFEQNNAELCAKIFAENSLVGVSSHGVNRFSEFVRMVNSDYIKPNSKPSKINSFNAYQQWDANFGPGPLNALSATYKVMDLSSKFGIGCIALRNSNHWMRPGYYGWLVAEKGFVLICWTNTIPIMPPWNGKEPTTGNNPLVIAVPRKDGNIVLDMALSQYSYGKLANYRREKKELPYVGGYNKNGNLTKNAQEIAETHRPLPIGYWKGSGLSLMLDLLTTILSGGKSTFDLSKDNIDSGMSQFFIAIDPKKFSSMETIDRSVNEILDYYRSSEPIAGGELSYPGERIIKTKKENLQHGIPVDEKIWEEIQKLRE
ncbi:MAG: 3-dehydro-L-gulonate 2-dehydrogenase [Melioribacteraceae bacterium]|nr:3-dehydro-L-gulonate 2-dehydrogenase [Melioribacteraceae bacterium]